MSNYIKEIFKPDILPNWIGLVGILLSGIALLFIFCDRRAESNSIEIQSLIINELDKTGATTIQKVTPIAVEKGYSADQVETEFYALVAKGVLLKTSLGFETRRFTTRLFDEIEIIIRHDYSGCQRKDNNNEGNCIKNADQLDAAVFKVMCKLVDVESERATVTDEFRDYLAENSWYIKEIFFKEGAVAKAFKFTIKNTNNKKTKQERMKEITPTSEKCGGLNETTNDDAS